MLSTAKLKAFVAATTPDRARTFYRDTLGLQLQSEDEYALQFDSAGTTLRVSIAPDMSPAKYTVLGWIVDDIKAEVASLRQAGVKFEHYNFPGQDADGIWNTPGGAQVAWFKDLDGNVLSINNRP